MCKKIKLTATANSKTLINFPISILNFEINILILSGGISMEVMLRQRIYRIQVTH